MTHTWAPHWQQMFGIYLPPRISYTQAAHQCQIISSLPSHYFFIMFHCVIIFQDHILLWLAFCCVVVISLKLNYMLILTCFFCSSNLGNLTCWDQQWTQHYSWSCQGGSVIRNCCIILKTHKCTLAIFTELLIWHHHWSPIYIKANLIP